MEDVTFTLPITKKKTTIKGYASYKVTSEIQRIINDGVITNAVGTSEKDMKATVQISANAQLDANERAMELMVVNVDGKTDNILEVIEELPEGDVDHIVSEINKVTEKSKVKKSVKKN